MLAKDKMWNGGGCYGFIDVISTSTTDISPDPHMLFILFLYLKIIFQLYFLVCYCYFHQYIFNQGSAKLHNMHM